MTESEWTWLVCGITVAAFAAVSALLVLAIRAAYPMDGIADIDGLDDTDEHEPLPDVNDDTGEWKKP